ncbi:MAG: alpha-(1-_3)-arabinofuranosyltransferase family protein [Patescibacteria group bacterium]
MEAIVRKYYPYIIIFIWSLIPLLWFKGDLLITDAEKPYYLDPSTVVESQNSPWDPTTLTGVPTIDYFRIVGYSGFWWILKLVHLPLHVIQRLWFCFLIFIGSLGFFKLCQDQIKKISTLSALLSAFFYMFNVAIISVHYINPNNIVVIVSLPWILNYYVHFINSPLHLKPRFLASITLWLGLSVSAWINPPAASALLGLPFLYTLFSLRAGIRMFLTNVLHYICILVCFLFINLWQVIGFIYLIGFRGNQHNPLVGLVPTTSLFDVFRLMGQWAFDYSYFTAIDNTLKYNSYYYLSSSLILLQFLLFALIFSTLFLLKSKPTFYKFALALSLVGIFLTKGNLEPFAFLYEWLYHNFPGFFIYREPYTKFIIYAHLGYSLLLGYALEPFYKYLKSMYSINLFAYYIVLSLFISVQVFPVFTSSMYLTKNTGPIRSSYIKVPDYWHEALNYTNDLEGRILNLPYMDSAQYLWEYGAVYIGSVMSYLGKAESTSAHWYYTPLFLDDANTYALYKDTPYFKNFLSYLNISYVVHEKDRDWRWKEFNKDRVGPKKLQTFLDSRDYLTKTTSFGTYTAEHLQKVDAQHPLTWPPGAKTLTNEDNQAYTTLLKNNLEGESILDLYEVDDSVKLPFLYTSNNVMHIAGEPNDIVVPLSFPDFDTSSVLLFSNSAPLKDTIANSYLVPKILNDRACSMICFEFKTLHASDYELFLNKSGVLKSVNQINYRILDTNSTEIYTNNISIDSPDLWASLGQASLNPNTTYILAIDSIQDSGPPLMVPKAGLAHLIDTLLLPFLEQQHFSAEQVHLLGILDLNSINSKLSDSVHISFNGDDSSIVGITRVKILDDTPEGAAHLVIPLSKIPDNTISMTLNSEENLGNYLFIYEVGNSVSSLKIENLNFNFKPQLKFAFKNSVDSTNLPITPLEFTALDYLHYKVTVPRDQLNKHLVINQGYAPYWQASVNGKVLEDHYPVNLYVNGWYLDEKAFEDAAFNDSNLDIDIIYLPNLYATYGVYITVLGYVFCIVYLIFVSFRPLTIKTPSN